MSRDAFVLHQSQKCSSPPFPRPAVSPPIAHLHHVDNSISVLHVVLRLANLHAYGAREALAALQNVEPAKSDGE